MMAITVPVVGTEIGVTNFGAPVANELNRLTLDAPGGWTIAKLADTVASDVMGLVAMGGLSFMINRGNWTIVTNAMNCPVAGLYLIMFNISFSSSTVGTVRAGAIQVNGVNLANGNGGVLTQSGPPLATSGIGYGLSGTGVAQLAVSDKLTLIARHDIGSAQTVNGRIYAQRIG